TRSSLLAVDGHFICLTEQGRLFLLEANSAEFKFVTQVRLDLPTAVPGQQEPVQLLSYPCWAAPILSHGLMYVRGTDYLVCLELIPRG
ncbi:MAG: hypothetical protein VX768_14780, partial [Planctomycetota bacterium]|nr:hypothetical protein [Planctomycetota bacterium]